MKNTTRRQFLAATALAVASPAFAREHKEEAINPIDAHVHVWTPNTKKFPLSDDYEVEDMKPRSFTPEQLFAQCHPHGVKRIVLIQMSFYGFDNSYMLHAMRTHPGLFGGVAIVDHSKSDVSERMKSLAKQGVRGFRLYAFPDRVEKWRQSSGMDRMWKTGADENLAMCLLADPESLPVIEKLCRKNPQTPVVIDHFARIGISGEIDKDQLEQLLALAKFRRVYVKTSAFYALGKKQPPYTDLIPMIRKLCDAFGPDRLMWGSDCPYQVQGDHTYGASIDLIREEVDFLSDMERKQILETTAERLFFQ